METYGDIDVPSMATFSENKENGHSTLKDAELYTEDFMSKDLGA